MFAGSRLLLPVPIYFITLVPKPGMKEGHAVREPSLLSGIAVLRRSGSRKKRRSPVAARSGGAGAKEEQVGRKTRCRAPGSRRGGCRPRGSGGVAPFAWRPKPAAIRHVGEEQGTGDSLPAALDRRSHRRPPGGGWASGRPPKRSSTIAWHREWTAQLVEDRAAVCPGTGPRFFIFFFSSLPSLVSVTPHPSVSFLSPRLSLPPGTPRPPWRAPPGRGGRGGVERSLVSTPRPARGDGGMWRVGRGREPWERSEAGGVNDNERHLRHSPVSSPTEELRKE